MFIILESVLILSSVLVVASALRVLFSLRLQSLRPMVMLSVGISLLSSILFVGFTYYFVYQQPLSVGDDFTDAINSGDQAVLDDLRCDEDVEYVRSLPSTGDLDDVSAGYTPLTHRYTRDFPDGETLVVTIGVRDFIMLCVESAAIE